MAYEKIANLKGPKGNGVANPRLVGDDLVLDLMDGTVVSGQVTVGNVRGNTGGRGATGPTGPTGPAPDMTVVVESLDAGSEPTVWKSGTNAAPTITLGIPDGEKGERGVPGPVPQIQFSARALAAGLTPTITRVGGTDDAPAVEIGIPQGDEGASGPAPSLVFESPALLAPGAQPYVNVSNPRPGEYRLQLGIPQGVPGTATESIRDDLVSTSSSWSSQKTQDEIADATPAWNAITGKPSSFPPAAHSHSWSQVTGKPSTFSPSAHTHAYSELTGVPSTFTPATHSHSWSQVTGKPSTFAPAAHTHGLQDLPEVVELTDDSIAHALSGTARRDGNLALLRSSVLGQATRCVVVVVGSSTFRAQEARIGAMDRLAYAAGATSFPLLDDLSSRPGNGVTWLQGAEGGTRAENYLPEARLQKIDLAEPHYVLHSIGSSDYAAQRPLSSYKTWMRNACARIEADTPGVVNVLVHQQPRPDYPNLPVSWEAYGQALREVADENPNRVFIDVNAMLDLYTMGTPGNRFGLVRYADNVHPSNVGHRAIAEILGHALGIPVRFPDGEELHHYTWSGGTHTAGVRFVDEQLAPVAYPRLVTISGTFTYRASVNDNSSNYWRLQVGRSGDSASLRLIGSSENSSESFSKTLYIPPMVEVDLFVRAVRTGTTTLVALATEGGADAFAQVVERPY